jgi:hypothetical protein
MTTDLTVILADRPGTLADVGEALGKSGINIDGMCGFPCEGKGVLHILVDAEVNLDLVYLATNSRLVVGASDLDKARAAL